MQLPDRRKLFQQRHHRREEIEARLRRTQIESSSSEDEESFEDVSDDEVVNEDESEEEVANECELEEEVANESESEEEEVLNENESEEEVVIEDESEEEIVIEDESEEEGLNEDESEEEGLNEDESKEEVVIEDESDEEIVKYEDESEEESLNGDESEEEVANEDESEEEMVNEDESEKEEEYNTSFSEKSLANSSDGHNSSNTLSLKTKKVKLDDSQLSVVHDETLQVNTVLAKSNNELMNKNNSDDDDKSQSLHDSSFNTNDRQNQVVEWMVARESQKPYGGIIATDMGTTDCKITILMNLLSKSKPPNSVNTQSEGESDLDETTVSSKGCTLILCPRSSIDLWFKRMNEQKNQDSLNVWLHYGRNRDISLQDLSQKDVVITTVTLVLTGSHNKVNNPLYQIKWHRIILDDDKLYNYKQKTSQAICQLSGICHWVFSGPTIIDNDDDEVIYSLIKFINYTPINIFENWKKWIKANRAVSYEKLGHLFYEKKIV